MIFCMTFINRDAIFCKSHRKGLHIFAASYKRDTLYESLNDPQQAAGGGLLAARMSWLESTESAQWA